MAGRPRTLPRDVGLGGAVYLLSPGLALQGPLRRIPWSSPVRGGVALALVVSLPCLVVAVATLRRARWSTDGHLVVGIMIMGWIAVQVGFIGFFALQPAVFVVGLAVTVLAVMARGSGAP